MKKTLLLTLALGLAGASPLMADVDLYITGSTAFRANVYTACTKLFTTPPVLGSTLIFGDAAHGGDANNNSKTASWCMTGTPIGTLTNIQGGQLTIHGLFTGSIQGIQTVEQQVPLVFATTTAGVYSTNTPTIGFSDASGASTPYPATGNFSEENVCVQPFVMCKSTAGGVMTNINNVTWEQLEYGIPKGRLPLSSWTQNKADTNFIYIIERTADSGTRRCETAQEYYQFGDTVTAYIYDFTNNFFFKGTNEQNSLIGSFPNGVVGAAGLGNANLTWGSGYVGGGDIKTELGYINSNNLAIAYLSMGDSQGVIGSSNWATVVSFNGLWPTAAGSGIHGNTGTNDYSPITSGFYPCWGNEVLVYPNVDPTSVNGEVGQNLNSNELGSQTQPGSILGVLDAQTLINGGSPIVGSIENEIELSKTNSPGATAIRLSDMHSSRQFVGGTITP